MRGRDVADDETLGQSVHGRGLEIAPEATVTAQSQPAASAIVRVKNEAATVGRTLESLRAQTVAVEIIVVDSGSSDGTLEIVQDMADRVVEIPSDSFTYGYALNVGAAHARGRVHFALSAHCEAPDAEWVRRSLSHYERPAVG